MRLSQIIGASMDQLIEAWRSVVRQLNAPADLSVAEREGAVRELLGSLAHLPGTGHALRPDQRAILERFLSTRIRHGFVLNEIVTELAAVGRCISELLERRPEAERPTVTEVAELFAELNLATLSATSIFNEHMLEDEQSEKRHRRQLQQIARRAFRSPAEAGGALTEMLDVIRSATGAETAVLMVRDAVDAAPIRWLTSGRVDAPVLRPLEAHMLDVACEPPGQAVNPPPAGLLAASGLRAVTGVALTVSAPERGALFVARAEPRFSASESRRLEGLADTLTLFMESMRAIAAATRA